MKALTLWDPWAMLVALGLKKVETRSWRTSYRGPIAIHAALLCSQLNIFNSWAWAIVSTDITGKACGIARTKPTTKALKYLLKEPHMTEKSQQWTPGKWEQYGLLIFASGESGGIWCGARVALRAAEGGQP